jgi:transcriptional regulator with XRE-family HTH domain
MDNKKERSKVSEKTMRTIGQRINAALAIKTTQQKELAEKLNITDNTVSFWCRGKRTPNSEQLIQIAKILGVSADFLLGLSDAPTSDKDLQFISDFTGLSINAIKKLPKITEKFLKLFNTQYLIDDLLTGNYLYDIINCFNEYVIVKNKNENIIKEVVNIINQTPFKSNINKDYSYLNLFTISELIEDELKDGDTANKIIDLLKDYDEDYPDLMMFRAQKIINEFFYHIDDKIKEDEANEKEKKS